MDSKRAITTAITMILLLLFYNIGIKLTRDRRNEDDHHYVVEYPRMLSWVAWLGVAIGGIAVAFFVVALLIKMKGATPGHIYLGVVVMLIGFLVLVWSKSFGITISDDTIRVRKWFVLSRTHLIKEISVSIDDTSESDIRLYVNGGKIAKVQYEFENFDRFLKTLEEYNLLPEEGVYHDISQL